MQGESQGETSAGGPEICLFGASDDTGNLGVSALMSSALGALAARAPHARVTVFDHGWGVREAQATFGGRTFRYRRCGARLSRRYHRPESYWNMRLSRLFGGLKNPGMRTILASDAVWDASSGDSFTDLYGDHRFRTIVAPKRITLAAEKPLILLPQTYGPFTQKATRRIATDVVREAAMAWARDERSFGHLRELLGDAYEPSRHRHGVDMAFGLEPRAPREERLGAAAPWVAGDERGELYGINVSGLIYNDRRAGERYGIRADYPRLLQRFVAEALRSDAARIVLVPHVFGAPGSIDSDVDASRAFHQALEPRLRERVAVLPAGMDESETKWVISRLAWFCGTRMHATIAALSSGVPATGVAYSLKIQGVFETCGAGAHVIDPRALDDAACSDALRASFEARAEARRTLAERLPDVRRRLDEQMSAIVARSSSAVGQER